MINWPNSLIKEIADRRCVIFLGAGVSASAETADGDSPPAWGAFLTGACDLIKIQSDKDDVKKLIESGSYLVALQAIFDTCDLGDYYEYLNTNFHDKKYLPSNLHKAIYELDSRIVVTTNFDTIYERYCSQPENDGYKIINYNSNSLADEVRSDRRIIIKAHGSIDDPQSMIFTRRQYLAAKKNHQHFYEILKALLMTNTCVFVGCGMGDPDIALLLEEIRIIDAESRPHYALIKENSLSAFTLNDWKKSFNVSPLEYGPEHNSLIDDMNSLVEQVKSMRALRASL